MMTTLTRLPPPDSHCHFLFPLYLRLSDDAWWLFNIRSIGSHMLPRPRLLLPTCISGRCSAFSTSYDAKLAFVELLLWVLQIFRHYPNGDGRMGGGGWGCEAWQQGIQKRGDEKVLQCIHHHHQPSTGVAWLILWLSRIFRESC